MGIGDWGLGIWGLGLGVCVGERVIEVLGFGPTPNSQTPNPQSPIPNPHDELIFFQNI